MVVDTRRLPVESLAAAAETGGRDGDLRLALAAIADAAVEAAGADLAVLRVLDEEGRAHRPRRRARRLRPRGRARRDQGELRARSLAGELAEPTRARPSGRFGDRRSRLPAESDGGCSERSSSCASAASSASTSAPLRAWRLHSSRWPSARSRPTRVPRPRSAVRSGSSSPGEALAAGSTRSAPRGRRCASRSRPPARAAASSGRARTTRGRSSSPHSARWRRRSTGRRHSSGTRSTPGVPRRSSTTRRSRRAPRTSRR